MHIDSVYQKAIKFIGSFNKLRTRLPASCLCSIYYSYVHLHINLHGIDIYTNTWPTHLRELITLNSKLLCISQCDDKITSKYDLYLRYNTLPTDQLRIFQ